MKDRPSIRLTARRPFAIPRIHAFGPCSSACDTTEGKLAASIASMMRARQSYAAGPLSTVEPRDIVTGDARNSS
jgi:hypothetical protein